MMWFTEILPSLTAEDILTLPSAALNFALAAGMKDRLGAVIGGCLVLGLMRSCPAP